MKMKKYIIKIMVLVAALVSCSEEHLDIPQQGVFSSQEVYKTADDGTVNSLISAVYYKIHGSMYDEYFGGASTTSAMGLRYHLELMGGDFAEVFRFNETAQARRYSTVWSYFYTVIYWCNMIIENLPENNVATESVKSQVIAEARTIRAIMMMYLVQLYGNPPLADHIMTGEEGNTPAAESWAFIETELSEAAEGLPSKNGLGGQAEIGGRLTKEAAYAYLGKAYLWDKKYSEAAGTLYNKVIATGLYELVDDYSAMNSYTTDFCDEYIWEYDIDANPEYAYSQAGSWNLTYFAWSSHGDGIYYPDGYWGEQGFAYVAYPSESFGAFMAAHDGNRSNRYLGTMIAYEDLFDPELFSYSERDGKKGSSGKGERNCEGYYRIKYMARNENIMGGPEWYNSYSHKNLCFMRYSEVLLNYAEAVAMGGDEGAMSGLEALNIVRNRAGLTDAPSLDMDNANYGVKAERRAELFFEGHRFIDIVRWGDAPTVLSGVEDRKEPMFYGYKNGNNSEAQSKEEWNIVYTTRLSEPFNPAQHVLFPIPAVDMNSNSNLVQNPGW